ncbi:PSK1 (YAL017W) and PSK2 (YOL045W) [Zygosaccharomyces parabailii]|nr:PSK1 (YAL017W) and PSK2 (YOL045W) [Zygosaccharomyces parabailii]
MPYVEASSDSGTSYSTLRERHALGRPSGFSGSGSPSISPNTSRDSLDTYNNTIPSIADTTSDNCFPKYMPYKAGAINDSNLSLVNDDEDEQRSLSRELKLQGPPRHPLGSPSKSQSVNSLVSSTTDTEMDELYSLPNESTHTYSYNPLSPNSLAVRLSILKRSLEILIKNPNMLEEPVEQTRPRYGRNYSDAGLQHVKQCDPGKTVKQKGTASAAALKAFVSNTSGSGSIPVTPASSSTDTNLLPPSTICRNLQRASSVVFPLDYCKNPETANSERSDLEDLLVLLNRAIENNDSEGVTDLHMMSLLNINKLILGKDGQEEDLRTLHLKRALLDSLAEPFFEHYNTTADGEVCSKDEDTESDSGNEDEDFLGFNASAGVGRHCGRVLHTFTSGKNIAPQAIFTCSQNHPWAFRAANDLACLIFGVSNQALKALTLLDLIHTDSRNFVLNKMMSTEDQELVFSGEIVAIAQPGQGKNSSNLIWASFWAKRKNGLLVCVFQKVPCDYVDVLLDVNDYSIKSISGGNELFWGESGQNKVTNENCGGDKHDKNTEQGTQIKKKTVKFANDRREIKDISVSLARLIEDVLESKVMAPDDDLLPMPIRVANHVNDTRYFTLNNSSSNIPGAVALSILEDNLKLKIHSLPYEAGLFVVDSHTLNFISCNKSILKNMFGRHFADMLGKPMTDIIPSFVRMMKFLRENYSSLSITSRKNKGLVLTEHFFRKIQAEMMGNPESFYSSVGIDAVHRDGFKIKIDLQLRVMTSRVVLLWITHSRDVVIRNYTSTPSQLRMLKENELSYVSSTPSSGSSSKKSSSKISLSNLKEMASRSAKGADISNSAETRSANNETEVKAQTDESSELKISPHVEDIDEYTTHVDVGDPELQRKLELTKIYSKDKFRFVNDGNFKLDQDLIKSITSPPRNTGLDSEPDTPTSMTRSNSLDPIFLRTPNPNIGAQKHTKKYSDFIVLQKMGEGAYGKVNLCLHKKQRYIVVIKLIFKERILVDTWVRDRKLGTIPSEIQIMAALNKHPDESILMLIDFFEDDECYYIETPIHGETGCIDLFDLIELKTNMTEYEAKLIFRQVVSAIRHLHCQGIVHRDIKDENIIVDSKGFIKLIDFGSAAYVKNGPFDVFVGTIDYAAPEVLSGEPYDGKPQDIWAIGVLLYTIVFKENPFYNIDEILEGNLKFQSTEGVSEDCINLIKKLLNRNPSERPTIEEVYNNDWSQI